MAIIVQSRAQEANPISIVYEFFDERVLSHLWFIALSDGVSVQLLAPTFQTERAARIFERCLTQHPSAKLLTVDSQLELARRIEALMPEPGQDFASSFESLCAGLALDSQLESRVN